MPCSVPFVMTVPETIVIDTLSFVFMLFIRVSLQQHPFVVPGIPDRVAAPWQQTCAAISDKLSSVCQDKLQHDVADDDHSSTTLYIFVLRICCNISALKASRSASSLSKVFSLLSSLLTSAIHFTKSVKLAGKETKTTDRTFCTLLMHSAFRSCGTSSMRYFEMLFQLSCLQDRV
eukprot:Gb_13895 [translate_table: standard]